MIPSIIALFLDYKCNFRCKHCSINSGPNISVPMSKEVFNAFFDQIRQVPSAKVLVFTGGEATLQMPMLVEGIRRGKQAGLITRLVTNAWWAKTESGAMEFLRKLKEAGLNEINTSFDDFHAEFIEINNGINLAKAARALQMTFCIGVISGKAARFDATFVKRNVSDALGIPLEKLDEEIIIPEELPTPSGRGGSLDLDGLDPGDKINIGCSEVIKSLSVHPNGTIKLCCGHAMMDSDDLSLGNILEERLADILNRGKKNVIYWWLHSKGPKRILETLGKTGCQYSSSCHACQELFVNNRELMLSYVAANKEAIIRDDILMGDQLKKIALTIGKKKEQIVSSIEVARKRRNSMESA